MTEINILEATGITLSWGTWPTPALTQIHGLSTVGLTLNGYVVATPRLRSGTILITHGSRRQLGLLRAANTDGEWKDVVGAWMYHGDRWQRIYTRG